MSLPRPPIKRRQLALAMLLLPLMMMIVMMTMLGMEPRIGLGWHGMVWYGYAIAMKRAMSELGVWHIKRWHRTGSQHMLDI